MGLGAEDTLENTIHLREVAVHRKGLLDLFK
jgi:hypothetical protein